jgi:hypothetical protein
MAILQLFGDCRAYFAAARKKKPVEYRQFGGMLHLAVNVEFFETI